MELYLVRHGIAVSRTARRYRDGDRPLTAEGKKKMRAAARGMKKVLKSVDTIVTSPLLRTKESAEIIAGELSKGRGVKVSKLLAPGGHIPQVVAVLRRERKPRVMIIGHEPDLSSLAKHLLESEGTVVQFKKGTLCRLDWNKKTRAQLSLLLHPKQLRALSKKLQ